jgi:hypothetical protein
LNDEPFDPYDDSIPVSERLGMQHLGSEATQLSPDVRISGLDGEVVDLATRRPDLSKQSKQPTLSAWKRLRKRLGKYQVNRRELASNCLEIIGLTAFSAGFWLIHVWLGLIVGGLCLVLYGVATSNQIPGPRD